MALLFDEAQGAFKDTGSQTSPMKKSTGLMRKQMSKMDEVAPRGHTLAYITPEEAQILNKGGGGIDAQGNQMQGPYGVPMYQGFMDRFGRNRQTQKRESAPPGEKGGGGYQASNDRSQQQKEIKQERPEDMPSMLSYIPPKPKNTGIFDWAESGKDNTKPVPTIIEEEDKITLTEDQLKDLEKIDLHGHKSKGKKWWDSNFDKPIKSSNFSANALLDIPNLAQGKGFKNINPFVQDIVDEYMTVQEMLVRRGNVGRAETTGGTFDIAKNIYVGALIATKSQKEPLAKGVTGVALNAIGQLAEVFHGGTVKGATQDFSDNLDGVAFVTKYPNATREEILQYAETKALQKFDAEQNKMTASGFMKKVEDITLKMIGNDWVLTSQN